MSEPNQRVTAPTPKYLWLIALVALLWSLTGAYDYVMTQTHNTGYMSRFTPEQLAYFYSFPAWVVATWAIAVWGGVLGSVLLLFRHRAAVPVFLVSLVGMVLTSIHNLVLSNGLKVMGGVVPLLFTVLIFLVSLGLYLYSQALRRRGMLR